jgi:hypothetical protein
MQYFSTGCQEHFPYIKGVPVLTIDSQWEFSLFYPTIKQQRQIKKNSEL